MNITKQIIEKYNVQGPRYTSYPTAPIWTEQVQSDTAFQKIEQLSASNKPISIYIHIPFCQKLCTFCGCMVKIRKRSDQYGDEYLDHLLKEIDLVGTRLKGKRTVMQFHVGGGTPNYLSEKQMERLWSKVSEYFHIDPQGEVAIEIDPRTVTESQLKHYRKLGFNRISMGVQDFTPQVQTAINRIQSFELVQDIHNLCRKLQFTSVNMDLIYGLPFQTEQSFKETVQKIIQLKPDRIALYSFAHVPWLKKHQTLIAEETLPSAEEKLDIFLTARNALLSSSYEAIAMDHFALNSDEMAKAFHQGTLYRNFMGYTLKYTEDFLGFGMSAIGFVQNCFVQNTKSLTDYYALIRAHKLPVERGLILSEDDQRRQWVITQLMCHFQVNKHTFEEKFQTSFDRYFQNEQSHIKQCAQEGLLTHSPQELKATALGQLFIRNVCMGFDAYYKPDNTPKYSKTI